MRRYAKSLDEKVDGTEQRERVDKLKTDVEESAEKHRQDERQNLVVGDR